MLKTIAVFIREPVAVFELGVMCEVFGLDRTGDGVPAFEYLVCGEVAGQPLSSSCGLLVTPMHTFADAAEADVVCVPACGFEPPTAAMAAALRAADQRGAYVMSVCSGAFALGGAGLLDGKKCSTHWKYVDVLARQFPTAQVDASALYTLDGNLLTSAGTAAGIDAALFLVRKECGSATATAIARRMVVPPHRDGGQRQYIAEAMPVNDHESLTPQLAWIIDNLNQPHTVATLAARAQMTPRTYARRFASATGTTPLHWITEQRLLAARTLLESSQLSVEHIAHQVGWGSAAVLRHHFVRSIGVPPQRYRSAFRADAQAVSTST